MVISFIYVQGCPTNINLLLPITVHFSLELTIQIFVKIKEKDKLSQIHEHSLPDIVGNENEYS